MPSFPWVVHGSTLSGESETVAVDSINDRVYAAGSYVSNLTLYNPDKGVDSVLAHATGNFRDAFLYSYTASSGTFRWATRISGGGVDVIRGATCINGDVYVTGQYGSSVLTFFAANGTSPTLTLPAATDIGVFIARYDSNGTPIWVRHIDGTGTDHGLRVAGLGNSLYVVGRYTSSSLTVYDSNGNASSTLTNAGDFSAFVALYTADVGACQWITRIDSSGQDVSWGVDASASGVYVVGQCFNGAVMYNQDGSGFHTFTGSDIIAFIVKYDVSGQGAWVSTIDGANADVGFSVSVSDDDEFVYITGNYRSSSITVYGASQLSGYSTLTQSSLASDFLIKYDKIGNVQWATKIEGTIQGGESATRTVGNNGCIVCAMSQSSVSLYNEGGVTSMATVNGDVCIARYLADGTLSWATSIRGDNGSIYSYSLGVLDNEYVFVDGYFGSTSVRFYDATNQTTEVTSLDNITEGTETFLAKYDVVYGKLAYAERNPLSVQIKPSIHRKLTMFAFRDT